MFTTFTRSRNTRKERIAFSLKEREDTTPNRRVMVGKQNPSSERKPRLPRRLHSDLNAISAKREDCCQSEDARLSFSVKIRESKKVKINKS